MASATSGWIRGMALACTAVVAACSLITDEGEHFVLVEVDPVVRQVIMYLENGVWSEPIQNEPVQDPSEVACAVATPRTCSVREYIRVKIHNLRMRSVIYMPRHCPSRLRRHGTNGWEWVQPTALCTTVGILPIEIDSYQTRVDSMGIPYDWRAANDELSVELDLS